MFISEIIHQVGKFFSPWSRPFLKSGKQPPKSWLGYSCGSFPSGHSLRAVVILYFLYQESLLAFWILTPGLFLGVFSRVIFFLHYPVDILGGLIIGYLLVNLLIVFGG